MTEQCLSSYVSVSQINELDVLRIRNAEANATIALQGAHLIEFSPLDNPNNLFVSSAEKFEKGKAIRGGIPICWPWFDAHKDNKEAPNHGFARTSIWQYEIVGENDSRTDIKLWLDTDGTETGFPFRARAELLVSIGKTLVISLATYNLSEQPFLLSQALHTYFPCQDIANVEIHGLHGVCYNDSLTGENAYFPSDFRFNQEIDWVLQEAGKPVVFSGLGQADIKLTRMGSRSLVVWNPWIEKSKRLSQFQADEYKKMFCVETTNVSEDSRLIKPNESHILMMELTSSATKD